MASAEDLFEAFLALSLEEAIALEAFLERAAAGEFGPFRGEAARAFLDRVERMTLANIEAKGEEAGLLPGEAEEVARRQLARFAELRRRYGLEGGRAGGPEDAPTEEGGSARPKT
ncbi:MAG: hypothetical protein IRZ11_08000 [Clostridia bacterium]|nr:hypothetical protein [Clostridia bacterium]